MDEPSSIYMIGLLYESEPEITQEAVLDRLTARIGNVRAMGEGLLFAFLDHEVTYAGGKGLPSQCVMMLNDIKPDEGDEPDHDIVQSWFWPESATVVPRCRYVLNINDFMAMGLPYKERLALFQNIVMSVLDVAPCSAIHWMPSQQYISPAAYVLTKDTPEPDPIYPAVNVRFYNVGNGAKDETLDGFLSASGLWAVSMSSATSRVSTLTTSPAWSATRRCISSKTAISSRTTRPFKALARERVGDAGTKNRSCPRTGRSSTSTPARSTPPAIATEPAS